MQYEVDLLTPCLKHGNQFQSLFITEHAQCQTELQLYIIYSVLNILSIFQFIFRILVILVSISLLSVLFLVSISDLDSIY